MKTILLSVLAVAMIGLMVPNAFAQTTPTQVDLFVAVNGEVSSSTTVQNGDTITFYGELYTADGQFFLGGETIYIKDDIDFGTDTIIAVVTTSNDDGWFYVDWTATPRSGGGAYDFYAVFEGDADWGNARSSTYSVTVTASTPESEPAPSPPPPSGPYPLTLLFDQIPTTVNAGDTITFSGKLITADGQFVVGGETICIKDDVDFGTDTVIGCLETSNESG